MKLSALTLRFDRTLERRLARIGSLWLATLPLLTPATPALGQQDSIAEARRVIERELAPLDASRQALHARLAATHGTAGADSSFWIWYGGYRDLVDSLARRLNVPLLDVLIDPLGATGQSLLRQRHQEVPPTETPRQRATMNAMRALLEAHGVRGADAEGDVEYSPSYASLRVLAAPFLSDLSRDVLALLVLEQAQPAGRDAALDISWAALADRLARSDALLARRPLPAADSLIQGHYRSYLTAYLGAWDNTPGFAFDPPHELLPALRASYDVYVRSHPDTRSGRIIRAYVALLRTHHWRRGPEVDAFVRDAARDAARGRR